jgi:hypothetical protein
LHSNLTVGEYGRRIKDSLFDPEMEMQQLEKFVKEATANTISYC